MEKRKVALITGASQGIGYELAKICAREEHDLILIARDKPRLQLIAKELAREFSIAVHVIPKDLAESQSPAQIYSAVQRQGLQVDMLINNAGFGNLGPFLETPWQKESDMIALNIAALTELTSLFAKDMVSRKEGKILNVSSLAAFFPGPYMSVYYATKAYVLSFSLALSRELKGTGVTVTTLCPGPTHSEFQKRAGIRDVSIFKSGVMSTERVAQAGYRGMSRGKVIVIPGLKNKLSVFLARFVPRSVLSGVVVRMQTKRM